MSETGTANRMSNRALAIGVFRAWGVMWAITALVAIPQFVNTLIRNPYRNQGEGYSQFYFPPMTPHSFQNLDDEVAELVVIFPTNVWEYDVLDFFPFASPKAKALAEKARNSTTSLTVAD